MAQFQEIEMDGIVYEFPADMADDQIAAVMQQEHAANTARSRDLTTLVAMPRGQRNNNPLNIDHSARNPWKGGLGLEKHDNPRFEKFETPEDGIRAGVKILQTYAGRGQKSIRDIIFGIKQSDGEYRQGWAPPSENDSENYVDFVSKRSGVGKDAPLDLNDRDTLAKVLEAMIRMELGTQPYDMDMINRGIDKALGPREPVEE